MAANWHVVTRNDNGYYQTGEVEVDSMAAAMHVVAVKAGVPEHHLVKSSAQVDPETGRYYWEIEVVEVTDPTS